MIKPGIVVGIIGLILLGVVFLNTGTEAQTTFHLSNYRETLIRLVGDVSDLRLVNSMSTELVRQLGDSGDPLYIAPLIDVLYFARNQEANDALFGALEKLTGLPRSGDWRGYFEWAGENNIALPPYYDEFKGLLLSVFVDPEFARFFKPGIQATSRVNLVEAVWGGVRVDGIPALVNSPQISPEEAAAEGEELTQFCRAGDCRYPAPDELVFGVSINGDQRAYPLRLLNWHEMFNDVLGHTPMLDAPGGEAVCNFRAPTAFRAVARAGDSWVQVEGQSAGCPANGWLAADALEWPDSDWEAVRENLPDVEAGAEALLLEEGVLGQVKGKPVALAYCTLCGAGILYDTTIPDLAYVDENGETVSLGETVLQFGSSGMLMRSNKLMYDRNTDTIWNAITGEPAFGLLATSDVVLDVLPVVVIDWATWLEQHPDTSVLSLKTGYRREYINGGAYSDYFNDPTFVMFPVWQQDTSEQANKEVVFAMRLNGIAKAYPLERIIPEKVTNDVLAEVNLVLVTEETPDRPFFEPGGAAVRAYERGDHTFQPGEAENEVIDETGAVWTVTEDALLGPDDQSLARLPGHLAFWFGWFGFHPDTLVYE